MRNLGRFLRASWDRSLDSAGRVDLIIGLVLTVIGRAMNLDLGLLAVAVVLVVLVIRVLLLSPSAMWTEAERERSMPNPPPMVITVEAGATINVNYRGPGDFSALNAAAGTATGNAEITSNDAVANEPSETSR